MISELAKYNLSEVEYKNCLRDIDNKINGINDMDWGEIVNKYNLDIHPDSIRKASTSIFGGKFRSDYIKRNQAIDADAFEQLLDIRKEKQKLSDMRTAFNKSVRERTRVEENINILESIVKENGTTTLSKTEIKHYTSDNDLFVCISDFHLGTDVCNNFGQYNSTIAKKRLEKYLESILELKTLYNSENVYVAILGDAISGNIHVTVQLENRENLIRQVQTASELLSAFVYELSSEFSNVYVNSVSGNHSRCGLKDSVLRTERLDDLIPWYMKAKLSHIDNIKFIDNDNYDATIGRCIVRNNECLIVHGDYDSFSEAGVSKLVMLLDHKPDMIFYGHLHHCSYDDIANVKIIRSGCFNGTGDDYAISKRLTGRPCQMVCVIDNNGLKAMHPIYLD